MKVKVYNPKTKTYYQITKRTAKMKRNETLLGKWKPPSSRKIKELIK